MNKLTRMLLTWLLAVVMPLHGIAAPAMVVCALSQHCSSQVASDDIRSLLPEQVLQQSSQALTDHASLQAGKLFIDASCSAHLGKHHTKPCGVCADCCVASVTVNMQTLFPLVLTHSTPILLADVSFISHHPEYIDPPPKTHLA